MLQTTTNNKPRRSAIGLLIIAILASLCLNKLVNFIIPLDDDDYDSVYNHRRYLSLSNNNTNIIAHDDSYTATGGEDYDDIDVAFPTDMIEKLRWRPQDMNNNNCLTRLANSTIHCGVGGLSPINNATLSNGEVKYYCGGVPMVPNYCLLPSNGSWELVSNPSPLLHRLGIGSANSNAPPRCKTMKDFINGTWKGTEFSKQEYIPSCSAIPLSPFAWTQHIQNVKPQLSFLVIVI